MKNGSAKLTANTWKKLMVLGEQEGSIRLKDLAAELVLGPEEALVFIRSVFPGGIGYETYHQDDELWIDIDASSLQYMLSLSPSEWIYLYQVLETHRPPVASPVFESLKKKVTEFGPIKSVMDLLSKLESWDGDASDQEKNLIHELEQHISEKSVLHVSTCEGRAFQLYPFKLVHLEGSLSLIAEDCRDHCLVVLSVGKIVSIECADVSHASKFSEFQIEEFIAAVRSMNEKETRLILKITNPDGVDLFPHHQFLGKPCMITNPQGDLIWAAYVEPCEALFDWVSGLGKNVEILDPVKFKEEYLIYCEEKLRKIA